MSARMYSKRIINGFKFRFHKSLTNDVERWVCSRKNCLAYMKIDDRGTTIEQGLQHNHSADEHETLIRQRIANACKRKDTDDVFERLSKLIADKDDPRGTRDTH